MYDENQEQNASMIIEWLKVEKEGCFVSFFPSLVLRWCSTLIGWCVKTKINDPFCINFILSVILYYTLPFPSPSSSFSKILKKNYGISNEIPFEHFSYFFFLVGVEKQLIFTRLVQSLYGCLIWSWASQIADERTQKMVFFFTRESSSKFSYNDKSHSRCFFIRQRPVTGRRICWKDKCDVFIQ